MEVVSKEVFNPGYPHEEGIEPGTVAIITGHDFPGLEDPLSLTFWGPTECIRRRYGWVGDITPSVFSTEQRQGWRDDNGIHYNFYQPPGEEELGLYCLHTDRTAKKGFQVEFLPPIKTKRASRD